MQPGIKGPLKLYVTLFWPILDPHVTFGDKSADPSPPLWRDIFVLLKLYLLKLGLENKPSYYKFNLW